MKLQILFLSNTIKHLEHVITHILIIEINFLLIIVFQYSPNTLIIRKIRI